jgi:hypothetical protein
MLSILVTNNYLETYGGSETFCFSLIEELCKLGHSVEYFTFEKGLTSQKIETELNVNYFSNKRYDIVFANHNSCIKYLRKKIYPSTPIIQICRGIFPDLEQPISLANAYVSISEEVQEHLLNLGLQSEVILNGINTKRFNSIKPINQNLQKVLSLCQSEEANSEIENACKILNITFNKLNKHNHPIWNVENEINNVDLVIGLGRSAYEGMSCGRPVIIYDNRPYSQSYADGYVNNQMINNAIKNNCSGRFFKKTLSVADLVEELKKYTPSSGEFSRDYVEKHLNISLQTKKYINLFSTIKAKKKLVPHHYIYYIIKNLIFYTYLPYYFFKTPTWFHRFSFDYVNKNDIKKIRKLILPLKLDKEAIIKQIHNLEIDKEKERLSLWNNFIENKLTKKYKNCKLKISENPTITATVVEARKHPHFKTVVQNILSNLQHLEVGLNIYHGTENEFFVKNCLKEYDNINYINLNIANLDIEAYNKIMLSKEFHDEIPTDTFLVFQTDTITFKPLDKSYLKFDYIGAPWSKTLHKRLGAEVGNGGLSLRSKKTIIKIIDQNIIREPYFPEDLYLSKILKNQNYNVSPYSIAKSFSTEGVIEFGTFGCHKIWESNTTIDLKKILDQIKL